MLLIHVRGPLSALSGQGKQDHSTTKLALADGVELGYTGYKTRYAQSGTIMKIGVELTPDRLKALLYIPAGSELSISSVKAQLADAGVVYGIQAAELKTTIVPEGRDRQVVIALGKAPTHAKVGRLDPMPRPDDLPRWVAQGEELGRYTPAHQPQDGMGVNGQSLPARLQDRLLDLGPGLVHEADGHLRATQDGWFFIDADGSLCVKTEGRVMTADEVPVTVATNKSRASVDVPAGCVVPLIVMREAIAQTGVSHGIDGSAIKAAARVSVEDRVLVVARESPPQHGGDARLDHLVEKRPSFQPDERGNLDFHAYNSIVQVTEGQALASVGRASEGIAGMNVVGEPLPATPGVEVPIDRFIGEGTAIDPENGKNIVATRAGIYQEAKDGKIQVAQVMIIDGDVDHASGSIETDYAVIIKGDIQQGFKVKSGADIQVSGVIEDARVTAQGNLDVKGGILPGKNRVKAHGTISAAFVREREVKCCDLVIYESIRHCDVLATGSVTAKVILGGHVKAANQVICEELGGRIEAETLVHVGVDPFIRSLVEETRKRAEEMESEVEQGKERVQLVQAHLNRLAKRFMVKQNSELKHQIDNVGVECRETIEQYHKVLAEQKASVEQLEQLKSDMYADWEHAKVQVAKTVFAHVTVRIGPTYYNTVMEQLTQSTFQV
jgi:uncharacterized protein